MIRYRKGKNEIVNKGGMSFIFKGTACACLSLVVKLFQLLKCFICTANAGLKERKRKLKKKKKPKPPPFLFHALPYAVAYFIH